ncbi:MAG: N-acetyltransferase [Actinobacteria bacterium]|nr:N-acetyltransferase [Actinomycetota bacterium]
MKLRRAIAADAPAILDIYNHEVLTSNVTFDLTPRTDEEQRRWIADRSGVHATVVAVEPVDGTDVVIGFGALSPFRDRPGYSTSVEDSVYVHRDHRGTGVGSALLGELVSVATAHGFHAMFARIVAGHDASINLHADHGFEAVGIEREVGRKFGRFHDVIVMERLL